MNRRTFVGSMLALPADAFLISRLSGAETMEAPIRWVPPATFSKTKSDLGLPMLPGVESITTYDPLPCHANADEGGSGVFEDVLHGTFNHHPQIMMYRDLCITFWTNHSMDENGPGMRMLARYGKFSPDRQKIDWGGEGNIIEMAPSASAVRRRNIAGDPKIMYGVYPLARFTVINGRLYMLGKLIANDGWTTSPLYRHPPILQNSPADAPIPEAAWSNGRNNVTKHTYDVWWELGLSFAQQWEFDGKSLKPISPLYKLSEFRDKVKVTQSTTKSTAPLTEFYKKAIPFSRASAQMRNDVLHGKQSFNPKEPKYAPGTASLAADGKNSLAHHAEFVRPDGKYVVVRDNLINPGYYYAAIKNNQSDNYPKAVQTNLYGSAMPAAGELKNGSPWILCNSPRRDFAYLTLSKDGITFDQSWLVLHIKGKNDGGHFKTGGPAYFQTLSLDKNIWVVYSVSKTQIGVTKMPVDKLG